MSADLWAECPHCHGAASGVRREPPAKTVRVDYSLSFQDGEVAFAVEALCVVRHGGCGATVDFETTVPLPPPARVVAQTRLS